MTEQSIKKCPFCGKDAILKSDGKYCRCSNENCKLAYWIDIATWSNRLTENEIAKQLSQAVFMLKMCENYYGDEIDGFRYIYQKYHNHIDTIEIKNAVNDFEQLKNKWSAK